VDLDDRLVVQPAGPVGAAVVEELGIEAFEVVRPEVAQRDATDARDDVNPDVAPALRRI